MTATKQTSRQIPKQTTAAHAVGRTALYIGLVIASLLLLLPFIWMITSSLRHNIDVFTVPIRWIPDPLIWTNYSAHKSKPDPAFCG